MNIGELWDCGLGRVMVHDLYHGLPDFMREADCVFVDPPYNAALENGFRTKAGLAHNKLGFNRFLDTLFARLAEIAPRTCFVECGTKYQPFAIRLRRLMPDAHLMVYPSTYYRRHPCTVLRAGEDMPPLDYSNLDEAEIIATVCKTETFDMIADPCMGLGLVGRSAFAAGRRFVGTELNAARLAVMVDRIRRKGGEWHVAAGPQP